MDAPLLLIADHDSEFQQALAKELLGRYRVLCCNAGEQALESLLQLRPDVLVLNLMLPEMDGITLLQRLGPERMPPAVLLYTPYINSHILEAVQALNIHDFVRQPCGLQPLLARLEEMSDRSGSSPQACVKEILRCLNFNETHNGSQMLIPAITLFAQNPKQLVTKELYPAVARQWGEGMSRKQVERDIRYAIKYAWERQPPDAWRRYADFTKKPSNRVFIAKMAKLLDARQASAPSQNEP